MSQSNQKEPLKVIEHECGCVSKIIKIGDIFGGQFIRKCVDQQANGFPCAEAVTEVGKIVKPLNTIG